PRRPPPPPRFPYTTLFRSPETRPALVHNAIGGKPAIHLDGGTNTLEANLDIDPAASPQLTVISVFTSETDAPVPLRKLYGADDRSEEHTSELQSRENLVCR